MRRAAKEHVRSTPDARRQTEMGLAEH